MRRCRPTDLLNMIEEEYSRYDEVLKSVEAETLTKHQQQVRDREQASIIREASMGRMNRARVEEAIEEDPKLNKRKRPDLISPEKLDISSLIGMARDRFGDNEERARDKAIRRRIQEDRLQLDRERFDLERIERNQRMEEDRARNIQQAEMQKSLLDVISKVMSKFD